MVICFLLVSDFPEVQVQKAPLLAMGNDAFRKNLQKIVKFLQKSFSES